ncbi:uncharacterized protein [Salminus brasiliensis]|uniref:uncharacterized protein n=1 Tax=Salminus brasiliensis TaxID=930266 RepID=UPI003B837DB1
MAVFEVKPAFKSEIKINAGLNSRRMTELSVEGRHVSIQDLRTSIEQDSTIWPKICGLGRCDTHNFESKMRPQKPRILDYLVEDMPAYPTPVEFHVSSVAHATDLGPFQEILKSEEIKPPRSVVSWWTLKIGEEEIMSAEKLYSQNEKIQRPFLEKFTTSPVFQTNKSQYGNYRFTFPLAELMELYQQQNCGGKEPVLRVFKTMFYKQEIVYAVLIHSPEDNEKFSKYPLLQSSEFVRYVDKQIVWRAQATASALSFTLSEIPDKSQSVATYLWGSTYYVWDQVCLAFHLPPEKALKVPKQRLIKALEACRLHEIALFKTNDPESCFRAAEKEVDGLKTMLGDELADVKCEKESDEEMSTI